VDSPAVEEVATTLATDNYSAGKKAGEIMLSKLSEADINSGAIGIIGVTPENLTTIERERGFREVIKSDGKYQLLKSKYENGDAVLSERAVEAYKKERDDLVGIFGTNEGTTIGIGNAQKKAKDKLIVIGFDYTKEIQEMIDNGILKAVIKQSPYTMGYLGVAEAVAAMRGYEISPEYINTGITVIDQNTPKYLLPR
jgi:ribose transport system substrate-binding protein